MIRSFRCKDTEKIFYRERPRRFSRDLLRLSLRKLLILDAADTLGDLRFPPGNRLKKLSGNRRGRHSIRINDQWRICFVWKAGDALDVEIVDYH